MYIDRYRNLGKKLAKDANIGNDRTGGSRRKARVRPPVAHFEEHFTPKATAPEPYEIESLGQHAAEKGFVDALTTQAQCVLEKIGYQHASSYFDMFKRSDGTFSPDATMKLLHRLILFDRKYEALLMEHIGLFELQFRARYAYFMSLKRGAFAHRNPKNFKNQDYFRSFLKNYQREFNRQLSNRNGDMIRAYEMYGDAPIWLAVEAMSFGTLSKLYSNTKSKEVRADRHGIGHYRINSKSRSGKYTTVSRYRGKSHVKDYLHQYLHLKRKKPGTPLRHGEMPPDYLCNEIPRSRVSITNKAPCETG